MTAPAVAVVGRLLRGVAALAATAAILVGAPILLWWLGAPLLPDHVPSGPEVLAALTRPDDGRLFLGTLTLTGFLAWAMLASSILAEIVSLAVRRPAARIPLPGFRASQALATALIATILAAVASPALASPALTSLSRPGEGGAAPVVAANGPSTHTPAHVIDAERGPAGTTAVANAPRGSGTSGPVRPARTYVVEQRDTLWRIAEKTLGDPQRWHEIYALNSHRVQPDGTHLTESAVLHVGWTLLLPDHAPPADGSRPQSGPRAIHGAQVVVAPGDTLTEIADEHLGTAARYREIYETNRDRRQPDGAALHNPDLIRPGWMLTMPSPTAAPPAAGPIGPGPLSPDPSSPSPSPITEGVPAPPADPARTTSGSTDASRAGAPTPGSATTTETSLSAPAIGETAAPIPSSTSGTTPDPAPTTSSTPDPTSTPVGRDANSRTVGAASAAAPDLAPWAAGATVSGLAAAGLITALALNRRRQHRHRPAGHRIRVPGTAVGRFEWTTGQAAATADAAFLDLALRCLALPTPEPPHAGNSDTPTPGVAGIEVAAVWLHPDRLQLDLAAPHPAHPPFSQAPTPAEPGTIPSWILPADTPLPISAENAIALPAPFPLLATVATVAASPDRTGAPPASSDAAPPDLVVDDTVDTKEIGTALAYPATNDPAEIAPVDAESDESVLLLDLEELGAVHIGGDRDRAIGLLRHIAVELAHSRWAEDIQVLLFGFPDGEIDDLVALNLERLQAAGSVPDAAAELWRRLGEADQAVEEPDGTSRSVLDGRLHDRPGDQWLPILLLAAEPDPADLPALAAVCDELAARGRSTAAVVTAAVVTADPLPGTELVVDDHGQLHSEQLTGSTGTTAPGDQLVAAHASAAAAAALVSVLHPSRQPAQPVPALTHPAPWAQNMNVDGSLHTGPEPDPSPALSADDPDDTTPPPAAPDGPDTPNLNDLSTSGQDPTAPDSVERDAPATAPRTRFAGDKPASPGRPVAPSETGGRSETRGTVSPDTALDAEADGSARNGSRALPFAEAVSTAGLLNHNRRVDGPPASEHQQPVTITDPPGSGHPVLPAADAHAQQRLALVGVQDPDLDNDLARWHDQDTAPLVPMIGILGEPTVRAPGPPPPYRQPWNIEVLLYLALHPHGVSPDKARTDLWPEGRRVELNAVRHAMHGARKWAGLDRRVDPPVAFVSPVRGDGRYRLRGHLLDWELFQRLRKRAQARAGVGHPGAVADYQAALGLVRAPVLSVLREGGYAWLFNADQRHDLHIPGFIVDTAHELVDLALAAGDTATARWAADLARRLDPDAIFDRPLTDLMRIAAAEDNRGELHRLGALLLDARGFDVPEELAPETFAIVDALLPGGLTRPGHH